MSDEYKLLCALLVFCAGIIGCILPKFLRKGHNHVLCHLNIFSGGIFLSAGLVHLLAHSSTDLEEYVDEDLEGFPISYFLCGLGILAPMIIEESFGFSEDLKEDQQHKTEASKQLDLENPVEKKCDHDHHHHHDHEHNEKKSETQSPTKTEENEEKLGSTEESSESRSVDSTIIALAITPSKPESQEECPCDCHDFHHTHNHENDFINVFKTESVVSAILLFLALSFHSVIAGLALGTSTEDKTVLNLLIAILCHKTLAAMALGSRMLASTMNTKHFIAMSLAFSLTTPVGIIVGVVVSGESEDTWTHMVQAFAAGTFLFVALFELIGKEFKSKSIKLPYIVGWVLLGFCAMSAITLFEDHDHGHDHEEEEEDHDHEDERMRMLRAVGDVVNDVVFN
eukprot:TRINITY_DN3482_c0_g2_i1.p1 TRINITY_DN3482_c0_g2~~TRINITY_DN3482_c0_g2_i1.p1  ORF type:complete len:397 (-),score=135.01 TRINITY_DN3482_c0_g2_i1:321-1511(-)